MDIPLIFRSALLVPASTVSTFAAAAAASGGDDTSTASFSRGAGPFIHHLLARAFWTGGSRSLPLASANVSAYSPKRSSSPRFDRTSSAVMYSANSSAEAVISFSLSGKRRPARSDLSTSMMPSASVPAATPPSASPRAIPNAQRERLLSLSNSLAAPCPVGRT